MFIFNTLCLHSPYIYFICINNNRPMSINEVTFGKLKAPLKVGGGGGGERGVSRHSQLRKFVTLYTWTLNFTLN